jgi:hypothetical protein
MNERINKLIQEATTTSFNEDGAGFHQFSKQKFAELIVRECANRLRTEMYRLDAIPGREVGAQTLDTAQLLIKKHFGVKE